MAKDGLLCWSCSKPTGIVTKVYRNDECIECGAALRSCRGCRHFDPTRRFQCKEDTERNIPEKENPNFCDFFQMRDAIKKPGHISSSSEPKDSRKKGFDDLFKD